MKNTKILITGLNGLIGWHLYQRLASHYRVWGTYGKSHPVFNGESFRRVNLDDENEVEQLVDELNPQYIIHSRGICDLDLCETMPEMAHEINVKGTQKILKAAKSLKSLKKFIYISTDHVFNGDRGNYDESDEPSPKHVYGQTKLAAEGDVQKSKLPYLIIRPGLVIGESFQGNKGPRDFLFSRIRAKKPTHLFVDEWRSPICADSLADQIITKLFSEGEGIYHLADPKVYNRFDLGRKLAIEWDLSTADIFPRKRDEDAWAHIRPKNISLVSCKKEPV